MNKVDTNQIVALAALVTSVVAVFIAWDESRLMRRSQEAAFLPIIELEGGVNLAVPALEFHVRNRGHGVAAMQSMMLFIDDTPLESWEQYAEHFLTPELAKTADVSWEVPLGYFPAGDSRIVMSLHWPEDLREQLRQHTRYGDHRLEDLRVDICYCSVFNSCWTHSTSSSKRPTPTPSCQTSADPFAPILAGFLRDHREES